MIRLKKPDYERWFALFLPVPHNNLSHYLDITTIKPLFVGRMVSHDLRYLQLQVNPDQSAMLSGAGLLVNFTLVELVSILSTYEDASEFIFSL